MRVMCPAVQLRTDVPRKDGNPKVVQAFQVAAGPWDNLAKGHQQLHAARPLAPRPPGSSSRRSIALPIPIKSRPSSGSPKTLRSGSGAVFYNHADRTLVRQGICAGRLARL